MVRWALPSSRRWRVLSGGCRDWGDAVAEGLEPAGEAAALAARVEVVEVGADTEAEHHTNDCWQARFTGVGGPGGR